MNGLVRPMIGVGSDERRQAIGADERRSVRIGAAAVRIEDRVENTRSEVGVGVKARLALPRSGGTTRLGAILAEPAGVASAK